MKFFLDKEQKTVHVEGCRHYKNKASGIFVGFHDRDQEAFREAIKIIRKARACTRCMDEMEDALPPATKIANPVS